MFPRWMVVKSLVVSLHIISFVLCRYPANAQDSIGCVSIFPGKKLFPVAPADGLAHQLSLSKITENRQWIGAVGGSIPVVQVKLDNMVVQGSVAATLFSRLIKTPGHLTVYTVDYKVDFPFDARFGDVCVRLAIGHISCHFLDDAFELLGETHSIQHANDYVTLAIAYDIEAIRGHVYAGTNYSYGTQPVPNKPWLFQFGSEFANIPLHSFVSVYGAFDIKVREENGWGSTRSFQAGLRLFSHDNYGLRVAYTLRLGFEERGQFYLNRETMNLVSAFVDF